MPHWKNLVNPDYLGAWAFEGGEIKTATIASIGPRDVVGENGRTEKKTVITFKEVGMLPLIMNRKSHPKGIEKALGTADWQQWVGRKIALYADATVKFGKEVTGGVRIKKAPEDDAPVVECADCHKPIADANNMTAADIAAGTKRKYGVPLCMACGSKRKEAANNAKPTEG